MRTTIHLLCLGVASVASAAAVDVEFFESRIRPVLVERCYSCHNSAEQADSGLAVDSRAGLLAGGDSGPTIVPGDPDSSYLMKVLRHEIEGVKMPRDTGKLDGATLADFATWIAAGAPDPRDAPPSAEELATATSWETVMNRRREWWSFQPLAAGTPPTIADNDWSQHPIDLHILAGLREKGLAPAADAAAGPLVRRLFFTVIGLPPTADEAAHWTAGVSEPGGVEALIDHLLASPHFGEQWARHWMDWIRYADTHGSEADPEIGGTWHYRNYLIRALNADVPFDQLLREHVAGDLLPNPRLDPGGTINESAIGPAHFRMVFHGFGPTDALDEKVRFTDDQINAFSKAFLGLTVSCARCHDHKFDPISQADYYALFGILSSCRPGRTEFTAADVLARHREELLALKPEIRRQLAAQWLAAVPALAARMEAADAPWRTAEDAARLLHPVYAAEKARTSADLPTARSEAEIIAAQLEAWSASRAERSAPPRAATLAAWDLSDPADVATWFQHGTGLATAAAGSLTDRGAAGDFTVAPSGPQAVAGIWPASIKSLTLSTKHGGRFTSPTVRLDKEYELRVLAAGADGATLRPVIQYYPRQGEVYPIKKLSRDWQWHTFDLTYWKGDDIHVELATARDMPLPIGTNERSWFAVRKAVLVEKEPAVDKGPTATPSAKTEMTKSTPVPDETLDAILDETLASKPQSFADWRTCYVRAIERAVRGWSDGTASDAQALLLDACLADGLLENKLDQLATGRPLIEEYRRLEAEIVPAERVPGMAETVGGDQPLLPRGDHKKPGEPVPRGFLSVIDATPYEAADSGRLKLADDLLRPDNPLTRRVIVNRVWHHLFGRGLAATPDNLGHLGPTPSHPALLDHLARSLESNGWSLKTLIRSVLTSRAWRLDSQASEQARAVDPENALLSHAFVRRLEAESVRDNLLVVSNTLDRNLFGVMHPGDSGRRSVYVRVARNAMDPLLRAFDFPEPASSVGRRDVTNVPAQTLYLLNDGRVTDLARAWARGILADTSLATDDERLQRMFVAALGRPASPEELVRTRALLASTEQETADLAARLAAIREEEDSLSRNIADVLAPARTRWVATHATEKAGATPPEPMSRWDFSKGPEDTVGGMPVALHDGAKLRKTGLVLNGKGYAVTAPLTRSLREKTLVAWVRLASLDQRGGGVMSIQTGGGATFDALVYAEQTPGEWLAGSDQFLRTKPFGGSPEKEAARPVHLAVAYHADGTIRGYRNGEPYGKAYVANARAPMEFVAGQSEVLFGARHLPAMPGRMLSGVILSAALYDQPLDEQSVRAHYLGTIAETVSDDELLGSLAPADQQRVEEWRAQLQKRRDEAAAVTDSTGEPALSDPRLAGWTDVGRAIFLFKEFIYLR